jgi:CheY-like chemotaxis protein
MSYKVLVVDDEEQVRDLFAKLLGKEKCIVKGAASGEEALEVINKEAFDVVLLDIKMPGISGIEALKKIKEKQPNLIVIMLTALGYDENLIAQAREYGSSGYIGKNMPISQIVSNFKLYAKTGKENLEEKK